MIEMKRVFNMLKGTSSGTQAHFERPLEPIKSTLEPIDVKYWFFIDGTGRWVHSTPASRTGEDESEYLDNLCRRLEEYVLKHDGIATTVRVTDQQPIMYDYNKPL